MFLILIDFLAGERQSGVTSMPFTPKELESICEYMKVLVDSLIELTVGAPRHTSSSSFANTRKIIIFVLKSNYLM